MKSLKFKKLQINESDFLSKLQMKKITGGYSTDCAADGTTCYTDENNVVYKCSHSYNSNGVAICCCGHDAGEDNCYGS